MPPRSPWMKRRIFGFQRRVWWPKWTPASSSSLRPISAIVESLPWVVWMWLPRARGTRPRRSVRRAGPRPRGTGAGAPGPRGSWTVAREFRRVRAGGPAGPLRRRKSPLPRRAPEGRLEVLRQRRPHLHPSALDGMLERDAGRMQELPGKPEIRRAAAVLGVADHRVPDGQQMRPDLVRAPGLQPHAQERRLGQRPLGLEVGDRRARVVRV